MMKLWSRYISMHLKSKMAYQVSFWLSCATQFIVVFSIMFFISALFGRFGSLKGFNVYEVFLTFSVVIIGYAAAEFFFRGFDLFSHLIVRGEFDRLLVRPRNLVLQVLGSNAAFERISKALTGVATLFYAILHLQIEWDGSRVCVLLLMLAASFCVFSGVFVLGAAFCFITVQGLEAINIFTDGGREACQFPMGIYKKGFLIFFTVAIPFACVNYYPLLYVLGRSENPLYALSPFACLLFLLAAIGIWYLGAKKYQSTGS